jgi:hypothetical protein
MSRVVLLVEPDVDRLGALASKLRSRGLEVAIADSLEGAAERSRAARPEVLLVAQELDDESLEERLKRLGALSLVPRFTLTDREGELASHELPRGDAELIAKRVYALPTKAAPVVGEGGDFRGDLQQVSVTDLLQLLSMNRRSGTLSVTTPLGAGELRLAEGEVIDAVYRRVDGEKALFRLLAESEGSFAFAGGSQQALRRIERPTHMLLMEGLRQADEGKKLRASLALEDQSLLAIGTPPDDAPELEQRVALTLATPRTLPQLLDEVSAPDLEILQALEQLLKSNVVRSLAAGAARVELADPERMSVLAALAKRVARAGFDGATRIGIAGSQQRLATLLAALGSLVEASVTSDVPAAPVPHALAKLKLGEGVDLEIVGLPLVEAYAPIWSLVLPSLTSVARVELEGSELLESCAALAGVNVIDATALLGDGGDSDPTRVAGLIRMALESAAEG